MIGGVDTFVEDLYYYIVPSGLKRGYNVLIIDLPGQGILPSKGLAFEADTETSLKKVIDFMKLIYTAFHYLIAHNYIFMI